jgi:BMFP domain-containing protein YqiC
MSQKQYALFDDRFLESFAGTAIVNDPKVAIIELVANAWDAGATTVEIKWPSDDGDKFSIIDNGHGMTDSQFNKRFRTLAYNRSSEQGLYAEIPNDLKSLIGKRPTFGKNGKGRLGAFAFGDTFCVRTWRNDIQILYKVSKDFTHTLAFQKQGEPITFLGHGTEIFNDFAVKPYLNAEDARREIGMRFLTDPHFNVFVNGIKITFQDIPEHNITTIELPIDSVGKVKIIVIDVQSTDKTTQQHGIAWHVKRRLVGECTWKGSGSEHLLDGRRIAAKRYIFIVEADALEEAVSHDWTGFLNSNEKWKKASEEVHKAIKEYLIDLTKGQREETFKAIESATKPALKKMGIVSREKWETLIKEVQEECPSINELDLQKIGELLANLENSQSKYSLIHTLAAADIDELDNLNEILLKWDIDFAKLVLDEIEYRTTLLEKLQSKVLNKHTDEVHELQPLFHRGLWIFGPEYETIEFTSNQGMTKVIQDIFGVTNIQGSRNRPDFAIVPDGSVGLYSLARFDNEGSEIGIEKLVIIELKKPEVAIGDEQKNQAWNYVKELLTKGLLRPYSSVTCFVLGSELKPHEGDLRIEKELVKIQPLEYDIVIRRAKSRLLNLYDKVKNAPFLENTRARQFMLEKSQLEIYP